MSSHSAERAGLSADVRVPLERYYTAYYRDTLGIPSWRELVAVRLADEAYERSRLERLQWAIGRSLGGCRVLNVGCGTGGFNTAAEHAGAETWGVDPSPDAVAIAARRVRPGRVLRGEAEVLPFAARTFDVVYCYSALEHVADARRALREMIRVLRPGGALYLHTPNRWTCFEGHYKVVWIPGLPRWLTRLYLAARHRPPAFLDTLRLLSLRECRALLDASGGRVVRVLDDGANRRVGGPLWPVIRLFYASFGIGPYLEIVATRKDAA